MNYLSTWTLFKKETWRFLKVYNQTLVAPVITSLLFLAVFHLAMDGHVSEVAGVPFTQFMAAGLIIMTVVQQSFANSSSSLVMSKVIGMVVDLLMPPFSAAQIMIAMIGSCIVRGVMVGIISAVVISFFIHIEVHHIWAVVYFLIMSSALLGLLGVFAGIVSETFDHMSAITSYIITPLAFLSGTFYSIEKLPEGWQTAAHLNPFFYMIDGFRYGMTGHTDTNIWLGAGVVLVANIGLWLLSHRLISKGYRLKT